ncbi:MAG: ABC transporter ATP-binding protein, partial [Pseudonocardiaceae bacterium]
VCELVRQSQRDVFVRSPRRGGLTRVLTGMGATVLAEPCGGLSVAGLDAYRIAFAAAEHFIPIQELRPRSAA